MKMEQFKFCVFHRKKWAIIASKFAENQLYSCVSSMTNFTELCILLVHSPKPTNHISLYSRPFIKWKLWAEDGMALSSRENSQGGMDRQVLKKDSRAWKGLPCGACLQKVMERVLEWSPKGPSAGVTEGVPVLHIHQDGKLHQSLPRASQEQMGKRRGCCLQQVHLPIWNGSRFILGLVVDKQLPARLCVLWIHFHCTYFNTIFLFPH